MNEFFFRSILAKNPQLLQKMWFRSIHGPISLTSFKTNQGNIIHLFGDMHDNKHFNLDADNYIFNVIKKIKTECIVFYESNLHFFSKSDLTQLTDFGVFPLFPNLYFIESDIREINPFMSRFCSMHSFEGFKKSPQKIDNCGFASTWVKLIRLIFVEITNLDQMMIACKKYAGFFQNLPSRKTYKKFQENHIIEFANILYSTFLESSGSLRFWFLYKIGSCLDTMERQASLLQKRYNLYKKDLKVVFNDIYPHTIGSIICDFVTLCKFEKTEEPNLYIFIYGNNHCLRMSEYFTKFKNWEMIQSFPMKKQKKRKCGFPNVQARETKELKYDHLPQISQMDGFIQI
jgi:hypothetical protein